MEELSLFPLYHSPNQIVAEKRVYSKEDINQLNLVLNQSVFPVYSAPYPDGSKRVWHGVSHAVRATLFALILTEMSREAGKQLGHDPVSLLIATALHDSAREDDGEDEWDQQSGEFAKKVILDEMKVSEEEGSFFQNCVVDKDNKNPTSIEKKILHDADCLEIIRCLRKPDDFKFSELRMTNDLQEGDVLRLVEEAKKLIALTDKKTIKYFIENSKSPLQYLLSIVHYSYMEHGGKFQLAEIYAFEAMRSLKITNADNPDYILTKEIEDTIDQFWQQYSD